MTNLILTNCGFLVPPERVCWGTENYREQGLCEDCPIYAEKKKAHFSVKKVKVKSSKNAKVIQHAFAISVEAVT
jgi:hypothetical protein